MAKMVNLSASGIKYGLTCDEERIRRWEAGEVSWPREPYRLALAEVTHHDPEDLGFAPTKRARAVAAPVADTAITPPGDYSMRVDDRIISPHAVNLVESGKDEDGMRRREFVGLAGAALFSAVVGQPDKVHDIPSNIETLAAALVDYSAPVDGPTDLGALAASVAAAKQNYQACHYSQVAAALPSLLRKLRTACTMLTGDEQLRAYALSAEAHHVAASILLKHEDKGLAWLAADRSVQAAHASGNPLMIGSSARIITHALMDDGHHRAATTMASTAAQRLDADLSYPSPDDLSVYGTLLLRGAVAAALHANRHTAAELLDEAEQAGRRLGHDGNHMWTAFGPNNVLCHRVNIALRLGDAGTAIDNARKIDLNALPINERKATVLLDTSRAFLAWGKHDRALHVLRAAGDIAPEEITGRPATLRLVRDILATAPISVRREAREYAEALGVSA
ncbi:XRE family transcriptional regulator [Microtetraspora sp. AC03309]|uniref:XRE family transcriptional regulator n=1 Tax=Microtetraspora sp. AC03309 TaxID=2779376 RepID=UPI001E3A5868|nr:XRE family transcriptional regulator [Microtetraspora sp. AC03309]